LRVLAWIGVGGALSVALALLCLAPPAAAVNDPDSSGGTVYGDWTVTDSRSYDSVTIWLESGNLSVESGGSLSLNRVQLVFSNLEDGVYWLDVKAGGTLRLTDKTVVTSALSSIHYRWTVRGAMTMDNSSCSEMWGATDSWAGGIQIYSGQASITNSTIFKGRTGGISIFDCSPVIAWNTVRQNGQDGASKDYCFGIYATNTRTDFNNNLVENNSYAFYTYYNAYSTKTPTSGSYYYNGNYYYYSPGLSGGDYYRYLYDYLYAKGNVWGTGMRIENSPGVTVRDNKIRTNGWAPGSQFTSVTNTPDGPNYQIYYWYKYFYCGNVLYGTGLLCVNSTVKMTGNTLDRNGFDQSNTYTGDYICTNGGTDVMLLNCSGDITQNQIWNAPCMIYLYKSSPNITDNNIYSNYGSYSMMSPRTAYGVRNELSSPYIYNNTIKLTVLDYPFSKGGSVVFNADYMIGVENIRSPGVRVERCKISVESTGYCGITLTGVNATLKSTGIRVTNSSVDISFSGTKSSYMALAPWANAQLAFLSDIYFNNVSMKATGDPTQPVNGMLVTYGASTLFLNSSMSGQGFGVFVTDYSKAFIDQSKVTGALRVGIQAETLSEVTVVNSAVLNCARGVLSVQSRVLVRDCTFSNGHEFMLDKASTVNVYNTPHTKNAASMMDSASWINVSWPITLKVTWQNGLPAERASVFIQTISGEKVFQGVTDETGAPAGTIWVKEYFGHLQTITQYTPHRIGVSKGRSSSLDLFVIDKALTIDFMLVDTVPPDLQVTYPFDQQRLNTSIVEFHGKATDPEAGLLGGTVEINIDNTGWVGVEVDETFHTWKFSRPLGDGLHVVRLKATDIAGNVARGSLSVFVDTTGPSLYVFSPTDGCFTNQRTLTVRGITENNMVVTVNGISAELEGRHFSKPVSLEDGPNLITVVASDGAGNARVVQLRVTLDNLPPLLEIRSPVDGSYTNQDPVSILGSTEPTAIITVNGVRTQLVESSFEALVGLSEGANTITIWARDLAGNSASRTLTVYLDTVPPDVTLFSPRDGLWTNRSKVLVSGATEQGAAVTINGQNINVISNVFSGYVELYEGPNRIEVQARDGAGNRFSTGRTVFLDTRLPDLVVSTPADRSVWDTRIIEVVGSVDHGSEVEVNGRPVQVRDFVFTTTVQFSEDGNQVLEISAQDGAGNSVIVTRTVSIDTTLPQILFSYPPDGLRTRQRMITVSGQTEPHASVIVNTETLLAAGRDGLFQVPVVLEDGENRITVTTTDAAGNALTESRTVIKAKPEEVVKEDLSWVLNMTGLLIGMGIGIPAMAFAVTEGRRRRRAGILAELEAAEEARREREAEAARVAALPKVEKMGKRRARAAVAVKEEKAPEALPEAPKAEAAAPEAAKTGLKDKSGATEVSPDEIDQETKMRAKSEPEAGEPGGGKAETTEAGLKDKGGEAEGEAGETEGSGITPKDR